MAARTPIAARATSGRRLGDAWAGVASGGSPGCSTTATLRGRPGVRNHPTRATLERMGDTPLATDGDLAIRRLRDDDADYALLVRWRATPHVREWWDPDDPLPD